MKLPYNIIKEVVFDIDKKQLIDIQHSARLQYDLLKLDAVIKAKVEYNKQKIRIIYNPESADNEKQKMSLNQIKQFLEKQGIKMTNAKALEHDYDYYKKFYSIAFNPKELKHNLPYGSK